MRLLVHNSQKSKYGKIIKKGAYHEVFNAGGRTCVKLGLTIQFRDAIYAGGLFRVALSLATCQVTQDACFVWLCFLMKQL
jgi:hypothetical protein